MKSKWEEFFDEHAPHYHRNVFVRNTVAEVDFFLNLYPISRGATILDVGCGIGRHSIELARRGYRPTGIDLSGGMLEQAQKNAGDLPIEFIKADATQFDLGRKFDAAISLCEGAFNLLSEEENADAHDRRILKNIANHLESGAPFLLTALNGYTMIRQMDDAGVAAGAFDPATMVAEYQDEMNLPEGKKVVEIRERLFIPPEMVRMLRETGFRCDHVYGGTAGEWARRSLKLDEIEAMYVCRRM